MPKRNKPLTETNVLTDTWGRKNRILEDKTCPECGTVFHPLRQSSKYCSKNCRWTNNGKHQIPTEDTETWWINNRGYVEGRVWRNGKKRRIKKHRWIMEQYIGRKLIPFETVHHKNENKLDNRIENLEITRHGKHSTDHNKKRIYKKGYKPNFSEQERKNRSERAKKINLNKLGLAAIAAAEGRK